MQYQETGTHLGRFMHTTCKVLHGVLVTALPAHRIRTNRAQNGNGAAYGILTIGRVRAVRHYLNHVVSGGEVVEQLERQQQLDAVKTAGETEAMPGHCMEPLWMIQTA